MGYYSRTSGILTVTSPDPISDTYLEKYDLNWWADVDEHGDGLTYDLDFGNSDSHKAYSLEQDLITWVKENPVTVHGDLIVQGEDPEDRWKLNFDGRTITKFETDMVWKPGKVVLNG